MTVHHDALQGAAPAYPKVDNKDNSETLRHRLQTKLRWPIAQLLSGT